MIEPIKNILGGNRDYLQRIFLSNELQKALKRIHQDAPRISVGDSVVVLHCPNNAAAAFWRMRRNRLYAEVGNVLGKKHGYTIRIKITA